MWDEDRRELSQADGVHHTHIQAHEGQNEDVAHFLHHPELLQTEETEYSSLHAQSGFIGGTNRRENISSGRSIQILYFSESIGSKI